MLAAPTIYHMKNSTLRKKRDATPGRRLRPKAKRKRKAVVLGHRASAESARDGLNA